MMQGISREESEIWRANPVTERFFRELERMADEESIRVGAGATLNTDSAENTLATTARSVGYVSGLRAAARILSEGKEE